MDVRGGRMGDNTSPTFSWLNRAESEAILSRHHVGRIAYGFHDRIDIEPIHYVYEDGWVYGRTSPGAKLATLTHHRWVAFEVDEVDGPLDWRSVVVHGAVYLLSTDGPSASEADTTHAVTLLRRFFPSTFTPDDPTPFRTVLFRLAAAEITGRRATTSKAAPA